MSPTIVQRYLTPLQWKGASKHRGQWSLWKGLDPADVLAGQRPCLGRAGHVSSEGEGTLLSLGHNRHPVVCCTQSSSWSQALLGYMWEFCLQWKDKPCIFQSKLPDCHLEKERLCNKNKNKQKKNQGKKRCLPKVFAAAWTFSVPKTVMICARFVKSSSDLKNG